MKQIDRDFYNKIDNWFEEHKEEYARDLMRIVRHPSVSVPGDEGFAFGRGCHDCLRDFLLMAQEYGFKTHNFEDHVGVVLYEEMGACGNESDALPFLEYDRLIGIWNHLDVVPVGDGWEYPPFEPTRIGNLIIGRGIDDNKAPAVGMLYVFRALRELGFKSKWQFAMFEGCDEERGMTDLLYYTENYKCPALSIVADCGFPVCYGEKGMMEGNLVGKTDFSEMIVSLNGGTASNIIPDKAVAVLKAKACGDNDLTALLRDYYDDTHVLKELVEYTYEDETLTITAKGVSKHSAFPEGSINAINVLMKVLGRMPGISENDKKLSAEIEMLTSEYTGANENIAFKDDISGATVASGTVLKLRERKPVLTINIRYAITADRNWMHKNLEEYGIANELTWELDHDSPPNHFPKDHPAVSLLTDTFNGIMNENREPYVIGAGTYARKLPHAFPYGIGGLPKTDEEKELVKKLFKPGHGSYHQPDEHCNLRTVLLGMKIYAYSLYVMDELNEL